MIIETYWIISINEYSFFNDIHWV